MAQNSQWSTIEGGITNSFPLSINRTAYWTALRRGECYYQDMTDRNRRGVLSFEAAPQPSKNFTIKRLEKDQEENANQIKAFFAYGRWWGVDPGAKHTLIASDLGKPTPDFTKTIPILIVNGVPQNNVTVTHANAIPFIEDSQDPIQLIATDGDGKIFVIKSGCGYVLEGANQDPSVWRKSAPEFSIGTVHQGPSFTNAFLNGNIILVWDGNGEHGRRHYQWSGRGAAVELSEDIRELTEGDTQTTTAAINWSQQLVLIGSVCYDMNARRIFFYSGKPAASYTSRPFYDPMYRTQTVQRLAFITDGRDGTFDAVIEYGQVPDKLQKTKAFKVSVKPSTRNRFRHVWILDIPILCRVWRVSIENLAGCAISQIDADVSINPNPDFEEQL